MSAVIWTNICIAVEQRRKKGVTYNVSNFHKLKRMTFLLPWKLKFALKILTKAFNLTIQANVNTHPIARTVIFLILSL